MQTTLRPRTIFCHDNLPVMRGINSNSIDLIYLDPPFNKKKVFTAPIGSSAEGASFTDIFKEEDLKEEWLNTIEEDQHHVFSLLQFVRAIEGRKYNFCYLAYMAIRLIEMHRILKDTGSIYLHCDPTMSHYLKLLLDCIFGEKNFRNEIVWKRRMETHNLAKKQMGRNHDVIFYYVTSDKNVYNKQFIEYDQDYIDSHYKHSDEKGLYSTFPCTNESGGNKIYDFKGISRAWRFKPDRMEEMYQKGLLVQLTEGNPYRYKKYLADAEGVPLQDTWLNVKPARGRKRSGFPTQKPLPLLERIIEASSNEEDLVLDPFCGCATTCIAAEGLQRQWIGIDVSHEAYNQVKRRLRKEVKPHLFRGEPHYTTDPPQRTDTGIDDREKKWVYVISHEKYPGEYKVGIAKDWKARLTTYQTADPDRAYQLEYKFETHQYRELEKHIHQVFENRHEWVTAKLDDIKKAIHNYKGEPAESSRQPLIKGLDNGELSP